MSTTYHGVTDALIIAPGEQVITANSGLTTLTRTYQCAGTYEATAKGLLVPGFSPADYPLLALQTAPVAQRVGGITVFACTFFGVLSTDAYENYYDVFSTRNESASYNYEDYRGAVPYLGDSTALSTVTRSGRFGYGAPVIFRSYVLPKTTKAKIPNLPASAWSGFPVSVFSEVPPTTTVPPTLSAQYDHLQPYATDVLGVFGYANQVNSFTVTPYGSVNLVQVEYERVWKGNGKTVNPLAHDPAVLRDSEIDPLAMPPAGNCTVAGLTVTAAAYDSSDTLQASLGAGPITVSYDSLISPDAFPILARGARWEDYHSALSGLDTISASDTLHTFHLLPGSYAVGIGMQKEGGWGFQTQSIVTQGVPPAPVILQALRSYSSVEGGISSFTVQFGEPFTGSTDVFGILEYHLAAGSHTATLSVNSELPSEPLMHTFTLGGNAPRTVSLTAWNWFGDSRVTTETTT